jgi:tetratricopeptide (TPR) repeat protein
MAREWRTPVRLDRRLAVTRRPAVPGELIKPSNVGGRPPGADYAHVMFPSRPRQHELETESQRTFERLLPSSWIFRVFERGDYGIDGEVEIFRDGSATGVTFRVQLKGSASTPRRARSIGIDKLAYWTSFDVPVLVVYYAATTGQLYGQWAHAHDLHARRTKTAKSTTFAFPDTSRLDPATVSARLEQDVERFRAVRRGITPRPLTYAVQCDNTAAAVALQLALGRLTANSPLSLAPADPADAFLQIHLSDKSLRVVAPVGIASLTIHFDGGLPKAAEGAWFAADAVLAMGVVLSILRANSAAVDLFVLGGAAGSLLRTFEIAIVAGICFDVERRHREAFDLGRAMFLDPDPHIRDAGGPLIFPAFVATPAGQNPLASEILELQTRRVELEQRDGSQTRTGRELYNLAQIYGARGEWNLAVDCLDQAAELDPGYLGRDYFFRERGGLWWELGQPQRAATDYRAALELDADPSELTPLLADALLHSGHYGAARDTLAGWDRPDARLDRLAGVVAIIADLIIRTIGQEQQDRRSPTAVEQAATAEPVDSAVCWRYISEVDALEPGLWLGAAELVPPEDELAVSVLVAHMMLDDPHAWAMATGIALAVTPDDPIVDQLIDSGYHFAGEQYLESVGPAIQLLDEVYEAITPELMLTRVLERATSMPARHPGAVMRLLGGGEDDDVVVLPRLDTVG